MLSSGLHLAASRRTEQSIIRNFEVVDKESETSARAACDCGWMRDKRSRIAEVGVVLTLLVNTYLQDVDSNLVVPRSKIPFRA